MAEGSRLSTLRQETVAASGSFTTAQDVDGLVSKLDNAASKLSEGKNTDAIVKLKAFQNTLTTLELASKPKVDPIAAGMLRAGAQGVIDCISSLG